MHRRKALAWGLLTALGCQAKAVGAVPMNVVPAKVGKLIVPFTPGGPIDYLARVLAKRSDVQGGQHTSWTVENQAGASGMIAARAVAQARPDGQRLLVGDLQTLALQSVLAQTSEGDPFRMMVPLLSLAELPFVLVVRKSFPANTLQEFLEMAATSKQPITYGSAGLQTPAATLMEALQRQHGLNMLHVPFTGSTQVSFEMLAERIDACWMLANVVIGQPFKRLAVATRREYPLLKNVPPLPPLLGKSRDFSSLFGILTHKDTPPELFQSLTEQFQPLLGQDFAQEIEQRHFTARHLTAAALQTTVDQCRQNWQDILPRT
jgi:tripartite-type tricarboxylate transporter receptor subunit TctC